MKQKSEESEGPGYHHMLQNTLLLVRIEQNHLSRLYQVEVEYHPPAPP